MGRVLLSHQPEEKLNDMLARVTMIRYTPQTVDSVAKLRAELKRVHQQGYALNDQELEMGLRAPSRSRCLTLRGRSRRRSTSGACGPDDGPRDDRARAPELQKPPGELTLLLR